MKSLILAVLLAPLLSGCFAVFIPGPLIDAAVGAPKYCVIDSAQVGDRFTFNGARYEITELRGASPYYCRNAPDGKKLGVNAKVQA